MCRRREATGWGGRVWEKGVLSCVQCCGPVAVAPEAVVSRPAAVGSHAAGRWPDPASGQVLQVTPPWVRCSLLLPVLHNLKVTRLT